MISPINTQLQQSQNPLKAPKPQKAVPRSILTALDGSNGSKVPQAHIGTPMPIPTMPTQVDIPKAPPKPKIATRRLADRRLVDPNAEKIKRDASGSDLVKWAFSPEKPKNLKSDAPDLAEKFIEGGDSGLELVTGAIAPRNTPEAQAEPEESIASSNPESQSSSPFEFAQEFISGEEHEGEIEYEDELGEQELKERVLTGIPSSQPIEISKVRPQMMEEDLREGEALHKAQQKHAAYKDKLESRKVKVNINFTGTTYGFKL